MSHKYSASSTANSKHAHDWGRAVSVALTHLIEEAQRHGEDVTEQDLYGEDLLMNIREDEEGAEITLHWTPSSARSSAAAES